MMSTVRLTACVVLAYVLCVLAVVVLSTLWLRWLLTTALLVSAALLSRSSLPSSAGASRRCVALAATFYAASACQILALGPLYVLASSPNAALPIALLSRCCISDVDAAGSFGETPLFAAALSGRVENVAALLKAGADVNKARSRTRETPLLAAVQRGHIDAAKMLLEAGADPCKADVFRQTPLKAALRKGDTLAVKILRNHSSCSSPRCCC